MIQRSSVFRSVEWRWWVVAGLSLRRPRFDPRPVRVKYVVDELALGRIRLPVLLLCPVGVITPVVHTYIHQYVAVTRRANS